MRAVQAYRDAHGGQLPVKGYMSEADAEAWARVRGFADQVLGAIEWRVDPELRQGRIRLTDGTGD